VGLALGQVFPPNTSVFSCQFHSTGAPLHEEKLIIITGLHNKPEGRGASVASAAGPFTKKKEIHKIRQTEIPALLDSWVINTPSLKMLCPQNIACAYIFVKT
jgi:hypothetical protein